MLAAPDAMGHMGNEAFVIAVTRYFGQSSYITRSMAGLYFGKKGEQVNENATNLCCAHLPGGGFRILHDQVRNPYMQRYTDAILHAQAQNKTNPEGTIVADFVARDFPVPTQASNDSGLGARTDVLGEVKTLQPSKSSYDKGNCQTNRPVNLRATQAVRSYRRRAAGLDQKYAQEVVGDGTNGQVGPFETALG
ncbi:hypothetical protein THAOC_13046, partial [Thalassiosira oceanica]